jgi:hypothetical protein
MPRQWTEDQRRAQSEKIRAQKPWTRSTGPRTVEGKTKSAQNSFKTGYSTAERRRELYAVCAYLRAQRRFMRKIRAEVRLARAIRLDEMRKYRAISENELITPAKMAASKTTPAFSAIHGQAGDDRNFLYQITASELKELKISNKNRDLAFPNESTAEMLSISLP